MKRIVVAVLMTVFLIPALVCAADYAQFRKDLAEPYGQYKKSLSLTSKAENRDKAMAVVAGYIDAWQALAAKYSADAPAPFAAMADFPVALTRSVEVGRQALAALQGNDVAEAHAVLEEVRYLLWEMRVRAGIVSLNDKINDFHEAMEVVLDRAAEQSEAAALPQVGRRYGAWLAIKWEDVATEEVGGDNAVFFNQVIADGRAAVAALRQALAKGDAAAAKKAGNSVKGAYKAIFFLPECS